MAKGSPSTTKQRGSKDSKTEFATTANVNDALESVVLNGQLVADPNEVHPPLNIGALK